MKARTLLFSLLIGCASTPSAKPAPKAAPAAAATTAALPPADPDEQPMALWPEVVHGTLDNGLRYFILRHKKPEKRALLWLAVDAGSVLEDSDQLGLAHFVEHMAFNGTTHFPKQQIVQYLESIGMKFGAHLNAYTSFDQTVYQLEIPTDRPDTLPRGMDILRDWASEVAFDPKEVEAERGVVREEWRLGRGAQQRIFDKHAKVMFAGSRYADRLVIGDVKILEQAPPATLRRFYTDWYRPDLMAIIVVGEVDPSAVEKEIRARFGSLKNPTKERPRTPGGVPRADGSRVSVVADREATGTTIQIYNPQPTRSRATARDDRRLIVEELYSQLLSERFATIARKGESPFLMALGGTQPLTRSFDAFTLIAQAKQGKTEDALRTLITEVLRVERHGFLQSELDRAKTNLLRTLSEAAATEDTTESQGFAAEIIRYAFERELMIGRKAELALAERWLPEITLADLEKVGASFGGAPSRVVLVSGPDAARLPKEADVLALVDDAGKHDIPAWIDKPAAGVLMAKTPKPGKIVAEKKVDKINVTEWTLSNGVRVIVKPTDYRQDEVAIEATSPGGLATVGNVDFFSGQMATTIAEVGGVATFDAEELGKMLTGKKVRVLLKLDATTEGLRASGSATDLETMLQLVYLKMTAPRLDVTQVAVLRQRLTEMLTMAERNPEYQFGKRAAAAEWHDDLRHRIPDRGDLDKIDAARALAIYKERFGDAGDFQFVIVGAIDLATLRPLVEQYLGSLPATKRKEVEKDLKVRRVPGVVKKSWKIGEAPKAMVQLEFHGDQAWTRDNERDMHNLGEVLSIRLREVLREDKGGVYGVHASGHIARSPHAERTFTISFGCDPARVDELIAATMAEIEAIQKGGIGADYLAKVKEAWLRTRETQLRNNGFWAGWLSSAYFFGEDATIVLDPMKMVERATSDNVKAAAQRYLDGKQYFQAILLPEKP